MVGEPLAGDPDKGAATAPAGLARLLGGLASRLHRPKKEPALRLIADGMISRADVARDARQFGTAAILYGEALRLMPNHAAIHVQCGHMLKEVGDFAGAERHYHVARDLMPGDADLALQLGHFYKVAGRPEQAGAAYERAALLRPDWAEPAFELEGLPRRGLATESDIVVGRGFSGTVAEGLAEELLPRKAELVRRTLVDSVHIRRLGGRREQTRWGLMPCLRGVAAIRGFAIASVPLLDVQLRLNGEILATEPLQVFPLPEGVAGQAKYVFNLWADVSSVAPGPVTLELAFAERHGGERVHREAVVVQAPLAELDHPDSDAILSLPASDARSVELQVNARPSVVRPACRIPFAKAPRTVLVLRTDQLGDMVASIPAMRRLRQLLPDARLVGLVTSANAEFARSLGLFDEAIVIAFPDDPEERRRIMPLPAQDALRKRLEPYRFDIAIDLAESNVSRPLLRLSGAPFLFGFNDREWPWLTAGFESNTHDPGNNLEMAPHSTKVLALVERLGTMLESKAGIIRRPDLSIGRLAPYGIVAGERFAVLHTGARIAFSRWPSYPALAARLIADTELKVVLITDDPELRPSLDPDLVGSPRFQLLDQRLPFDDFDALLSFCDVFVGNDSGPKHLAALRGVQVVSIHSARINWNEWGQEIMGSIISRKVPCAGCAIFHDADECGKGFACVVNISTDEVFGAVRDLLGQTSP